MRKVLKPKSAIRIRGAKQNNLKNLDVDFEHGKFTVVTGVSGSGKSSLVFDTLYAEGQRRYVETFSPYVRQFMDRMDRPRVDKIEGILPAIAIDQTNPVRTSRSTVGTMTELNDLLKILFAQTARLFCQRCGEEIKEETAQTIWEEISSKLKDDNGQSRLFVTFELNVPDNYPVEQATAALESQGFTRYEVKTKEKQKFIEVTADRFKSNIDKNRAIEALDSALLHGKGKLTVRVEKPDEEPQFWKFSSSLSCANCDITYSKPHNSTFSFNSPLGACEKCKGFGRIIGVDYGLVIPDQSKSLAEGAVKPWNTDSYLECKDDLLRYAKQRGLDINKPFRDLTQEEKDWVCFGDPLWKSFRSKRWYGVKHFFEWLETKAYKLHVRVLLSRYRNYTECPECHGARLKPQALLWRVGSYEEAQRVLGGDYKRYRSTSATFSDAILQNLPGLNFQDMMRLPLERLKDFFDHLTLTAEQMESCDMLLDEIRSRLKFLNEVGLGYLTLDRQSRTLSGGEVQRINLTTALGTSLVNTLFVLDEPSIGLHPQDMERVNSVMRRLRKAGNTLVVVEHDPQVMLAADKIIDIGPGPGQKGGKIIFEGTPQELKASNTVTGQYLRGEKKIPISKAKAPRGVIPSIVLLGASEHNLKDVDIRIPLGKIVCVAGVSGSGKSTLVQDVLVPALLQAKGKSTEAPGKFAEVKGANLVDDIIFVDQAPIGKTTRSNPAVFTGAFDTIRKLFASTQLAKSRGYTAGTFSFNSGNGRCPTCEGSGFEHIEMQFLSDVYLSCPDCKGTRYRKETLEVTISRNGRSVNISEVLEMTVSEAMEFFANNKEIVNALDPLRQVGLDYLKLGQPVPTLSGGEAQRLKLARYLAEATQKEKTLFVLDEPTTGLHFADIKLLMEAFVKLIQHGHSVLIVEHNLDVIRASEWIIELGPEGGEKGGYELFAGTPKLLEEKNTPTGKALRAYNEALENRGLDAFIKEFQKEESQINENTLPVSDHCISVVNAREHNLKNLSVEIPRNKFTVVTGVSGSGKSTLAFDLIFNEGQRRYLESLNAYARSMVQPASRPDVDAIYGIPPTVAIAQNTSRGGQKSTVATLTEVYHFLRLLFVKLGQQYCPDCHIPVQAQTVEAIEASIMSSFKGKTITLLAPLVRNRKGIYKDLALWAFNKGYESLVVDGEEVPSRPFPRLDRYKEHTIELPVRQLTITASKDSELLHALQVSLDFGNGVVEVECEGQRKVYSTSQNCPRCQKSLPQLDPRLFSYNSKLGWCPTCMGNGFTPFQSALAVDENIAEMKAEDLELSVQCPTCSGKRLNPVALNVFFQGKNISDIASMTIQEAEDFLKSIKLEGRDASIAKDALSEILSRLGFLKDVGLSYLTLDRSAPTLSGGEAQRIRLASQLGTNLQGACYVLDEPTIGLHPRDNKILLTELEKLTRKGNSLLVVEHDEETIRKADHIIDIGPGAGQRGGELIAQGSVLDLEKEPRSITGQYLQNPLKHSGKAKRRTTKSDPVVTLIGANQNNLNIKEVSFPLNRLTVVTGVSGSGKSTLAREVLLKNLTEAVRSKGANIKHVGCMDLLGSQQIDRVLEVDQKPIGKTPRSCPATYIGFWDDIRKLYASTNLAKARGYTASHFSFNVKGGRCEACEGQGVKTIEMNFLPDVKVTCDVCGSMRFNEETLEVKWKDKSIGEVLKMEVDEAVGFFSSHPNISHPLKLMQDVGLGYLTLGQPSPTLSGGEAQRIKLVTELSKVRDDILRRGRKAPETFYVLDEPTVGLHMADVDKLIKVLHRLVEAGNTVVVIEHNLDVIAEADWIVDLGPEGGAGGGKVVFSGPPEKLLKAKGYTAEALREFLAP